MDLLEPLGSNDLCSFCARCGMVNYLPCFAALGFTGLNFLEGPLKDCTKFQKPNENNLGTRKGMPTQLFVLRSRPCSSERGVKTLAVKPCIIDGIAMTYAALVQKYQVLSGYCCV